MKSGKKTKAYTLFSQGFAIFLKSIRKTSTNIKADNAGEIKDFQKKKSGFSNKNMPRWPSSKKIIQKPSTSNNADTQSPFLRLEKPDYLSDVLGTSPMCTKDISQLEDGKNPRLPRGSLENAFITNAPMGKAVLKKINTFAEDALKNLVENIRPCVETRKVRVARTTYAVPSQISKTKGETLALRWIIEFANKRKEKNNLLFTEALAQELTNAYRKQGGPRQRRSELHKLAEANRSYIRYRWW